MGALGIGRIGFVRVPRFCTKSVYIILLLIGLANRFRHGIPRENKEIRLDKNRNIMHTSEPAGTEKSHCCWLPFKLDGDGRGSADGVAAAPDIPGTPPQLSL